MVYEGGVGLESSWRGILGGGIQLSWQCDTENLP